MALSSNIKQVEDTLTAGIPIVKMDFQSFKDLQRTIEITANIIGTNDAKNQAQEFSAYLDKNLDMA